MQCTTAIELVVPVKWRERIVRGCCGRHIRSLDPCQKSHPRRRRCQSPVDMNLTLVSYQTKPRFKTWTSHLPLHPTIYHYTQSSTNTPSHLSLHPAIYHYNQPSITTPSHLPIYPAIYYYTQPSTNTPSHLSLHPAIYQYIQPSTTKTVIYQHTQPSTTTPSHLPLHLSLIHIWRCRR